MIKYALKSGSPALKAYLNKKRNVNSYLSKTSQSGIIHAIYAHCLKKLSNRVKIAKLVWFDVDEVWIWNRLYFNFQIFLHLVWRHAWCVKHWNVCCGGAIRGIWRSQQTCDTWRIRRLFTFIGFVFLTWGFNECINNSLFTEQTAIAIKERLLEFIQYQMSLDMRFCVGVGFDGCSTMSGRINGIY